MGLKDYDFDWSQADRMRRTLNDLTALIETLQETRLSFRQALWAQKLSYVTTRNQMNAHYFSLADEMAKHEIEELHGQPNTYSSEALSTAFINPDTTIEEIGKFEEKKFTDKVENLQRGGAK